MENYDDEILREILEEKKRRQELMQPVQGSGNIASALLSIASGLGAQMQGKDAGQAQGAFLDRQSKINGGDKEVRIKALDSSNKAIQALQTLAEKRSEGRLNRQAKALDQMRQMRASGLMPVQDESGNIVDYAQDPNYVRPSNPIMDALALQNFNLRKDQVEALKAAHDKEQEMKSQSFLFEQAKHGLIPVYDENHKIIGFKQDPNHKKEADPLTEELRRMNIQSRQEQMDRNRREDLEKATTAKPEQAKAATFARRVEQSEADFSALANKGYDAASGEAQKQGYLGKIPVLGERLQSEDFKRQSQAERNFVNAVLRRESGAAISPSEFDSAEKQYFPRPGDTPEVLQQKAENRRAVLAGMKAEAGRAYDLVRKQESAIPLGTVSAKKPSSSQIKVVNGVKYKKVPGGWMETK